MIKANNNRTIRKGDLVAFTLNGRPDIAQVVAVNAESIGVWSLGAVVTIPTQIASFVRKGR